VASALGELESLQSRGLLVVSGEENGRTLSPVLSEAVAERLPAADAQELRALAAAWLEDAGRLGESLECRLPGSRTETLSYLRRCGRAIVARGYGARVAEVLRDLGKVDDAELEAIRGEALEAIGDWDGAIDAFREVRRRADGAPLAASIAWRFGAMLYLRGESDGAQEVLSQAQSDGARTADDALVSAWLSSNLWTRGEHDEAERMAKVALRQAESAADPAARAAAHVALALVAAARGDREQNERHYRAAMTAAEQAGDSVQLARIHANLSSRAVEEGDYAQAVREADLALSVGAGHQLFAALAMSNKAEALMHTGELDEARAVLVQSIDSFSSLGSLSASSPYTLLGALDSERGDFARARVSLERAHRLAEQAGDVHTLVFALSGIASTLAQDDPEEARRLAAEAVARASSIELAHALCASAWVELCARERGAAAKLAGRAESEARRTGDLPALASALELRGAAAEPPDQAQIAAAAQLWREVGDPIAELRAELILACCRDDPSRIEALRSEIALRGVLPERGVAGLLLSARLQAPELAIVTLGRFAVLRDGEPIPVSAWQSRKARDLLKLLAARRGRPLTRDAAAEVLWPGEDAGPLSNRLSVALSTLRKVLDPDRARPADHFIAADSRSLTLRVDHVSVDVIAFLHAADEGVALASRGDWGAAEAKLRDAEGHYTGDFLEEDLYEDWPVDCREEARSAAMEVSRLLARAASRRGDEEHAGRHLRRLLERDPYDGDAWTALVGAQLRLGRYGEARRQHAAYARRMGELDIAPLPLAATADRRP
jgi:DNA-binding SARP family transcriptional activator/Tfp pilus assembly protein PilF